jgi:glycosyltransferase involved in cell wall biosynthesis
MPIKPVKPRVCLNMIVKDEAHVIARCLAPLKQLIDTWLIVDTGSTDRTREMIEEELKDIPGQLHRRPWVGFGHNRTEAIELARDTADYLLFVDADEVVEASPAFSWPSLTSDAYEMLLQHGTMQYYRVCLVSTRLRWRSVGVLHEYLEADQPYTTSKLLGLKIVTHMDGGRSQGIDSASKYRRDAEVLEKALLQEPENTRYVFYLAQSYRDGDLLDQAIATYKKRVSMGGWAEEVWYSLFQIGCLSELTKKSPQDVDAAYLAAYQYRPTRAEPLVNLARYHRERDEFALAHLFSKRACDIEQPPDLLFLDVPSYTWRAPDEYSIACYYMGYMKESERVCRELLENAALPEEQRARVQENLQFALKGGSTT